MLRAGADLLQLEMAPRYGSRINDFGYIICHAPLVSGRRQILDLGNKLIKNKVYALHGARIGAAVCQCEPCSRFRL